MVGLGAAAAARPSAYRGSEPSRAGVRPDQGREEGARASVSPTNRSLSALPYSSLRCGDADPRSRQEAARAAAPISGFSSTERRGGSCLGFIPLFSDKVHLFQAAALQFFPVVIRCVAQTLCRITIIRRKRISYNMAQRGRGVVGNVVLKRYECASFRAHSARAPHCQWKITA